MTKVLVIGSSTSTQGKHQINTLKNLGADVTALLPHLGSEGPRLKWLDEKVWLDDCDFSPGEFNSALVAGLPQPIPGQGAFTSNPNQQGVKILRKVSDVRIGDNVWIMPNVNIFPGVEIGDDSIIISGSIVVDSVPPRSIVKPDASKISKLPNVFKNPSNKK